MLPRNIRIAQGWGLGLTALSLLAGAAHGARPELPQESSPFVGGAEGYASYRIPSLLVGPRRTLLAFCEGRKGGSSDTGNIDTVLKRSRDGGATWGPLQVVADDGPNTFGNPCPVVDRKTGTIWLLLTRNLGQDTEAQIRDHTSKGTREVWVTQSADDGATWSTPVEITSAVKDPDWTWYATGPGVGIQLSTGRLLIPCDHTTTVGHRMRSHAIYSDDHGKTWKLGGIAEEKTNECQAAELNDGTVLLNMRSYHGKNRRAVARSSDGGLTWAPLELDAALTEPVCQASLLRYRHSEHRSRNTLLFSNPASTRRERLTVRMSEDGGRNWSAGRVLFAGPSAYSCLTELPDGSVACLYERGDRNPYERIVLTRFPFSWITSGDAR